MSLRLLYWLLPEARRRSKASLLLLNNWDCPFLLNQIREDRVLVLQKLKFRRRFKPLLQKHWKKYVAIAMCILLFITWIGRWPGGQWSIANCDIGQGDGAAINLGNHRAIVIDVGPDAALEDACLKALGINEIPLLILSHFHADHVEGLPGLLLLGVTPTNPAAV